jgi:16S rRNA (uracil1498-N3)-methyltransferase
MSERFYIPSEEWNPEALVLKGAEAHHCMEVMRGSVGQKVIVFNGEGVEAGAEILEGANKQEVPLRAHGLTRSAPLSSRLILGQAIPKGKNMDLIIQKATELGAAEIIPFLSERTVVRLDPGEASKKREKWQRVAIEACKQSGQNWMPRVHSPLTLDSYFSSPKDIDLKLIASLQLDSRPLREILAEHADLQNGHPVGSCLILIGPEGDYTPAEINLAKGAGCLPMTLGPIVLRTETAAIYSLSILGYELLQGEID